MTKAELLISFQNDLSIRDDGWAQIAPFGDFPGMAVIDDGKGGFRTEKVIQRINRASVEAMVAEYANSRRVSSRFLKSPPIYIGHPDSPADGYRYPDKSPKGVFNDLACRADGFYGEPMFTEEGEQLIASRQYRALSGRWDAEFACEENGLKVCTPVRFRSAGLTNEPNLPVQLLNESEQAPSQPRAEHPPQVAFPRTQVLQPTAANRIMTPSKAWLSMVHATIDNARCSFAEAWNSTARQHPDLAILVRACGATQQSVIFFSNTRALGKQEAVRKHQAREKFLGAVHARQESVKCDYQTAYNWAMKTRAELFNEMERKPASEEAYPGVVPARSPQVTKMFRLPMDTTQAEWSAAWKGNGSSMALFDPGKIFAALVEQIQADKDLDYSAAVQAAKSRFPDLWFEVQALAKQKV